MLVQGGGELILQQSEARFHVTDWRRGDQLERESDGKQFGAFSERIL